MFHEKYFISFFIFFFIKPEHRDVYKSLQLTSLWVDSPRSAAVFLSPVRISLSPDIRTLLYMVPSNFLALLNLSFSVDLPVLMKRFLLVLLFGHGSGRSGVTSWLI